MGSIVRGSIVGGIIQIVTRPHLPNSYLYRTVKVPYCHTFSLQFEGDWTFQPPTIQPPTFQPPTIQPPTFQPPTIQPPTFQPPTIQPPTFQPPIKADLPRLYCNG